MAISVVQWLWIWACLFLWLEQPTVGAWKNEISTYIDLVQEQGNLKVDGGLLSRSVWTSGEAPSALNSSSGPSNIKIARWSYLVYQNDTGPNFTASFETSRMEGLMKSLVADLFSRSRDDIDTDGVLPFWTQEKLDNVVPFNNVAVYAGIVLSINASKGPDNPWLSSKGTGVSSIEAIAHRHQTGALINVLPEFEPKEPKIRLRTSLWYDQNKAFAFLFDAVQYQTPNPKNESASDDTQDFEIKTGMVIRVVPLNQEDCKSQDFTYVLSCIGSDATNQTCTYNDNWKPEPELICNHVGRNPKMPTATTTTTTPKPTKTPTTTPKPTKTSTTTTTPKPTKPPTTTTPKPTIGVSGSVDAAPKLSTVAVLVILVIAASVGPLQG